MAKYHKASMQRFRLAEDIAKPAADNARKAEEKRRKQAEKQVCENTLLAGKTIEFDGAHIREMNGTELDIQVKLVRRLDLKIPGTKKCILPAMSKLKVGEKRSSLCDVLTNWQAEIHRSTSAARVDTHSTQAVVQGVHGQDDDWEDLEDDF
jgi:hypothetical protein